MHKRIVKWSLLIVVITLGTYFTGYFFSSTSEAFEVAKDFVFKSTIAQKELGEITEFKLAPFGYELESVGDQGAAEFECKIIGKARSGKVYITLKKKSSVWQVIHAKLEVDQFEFQRIEAHKKTKESSIGSRGAD